MAKNAARPSRTSARRRERLRLRLRKGCARRWSWFMTEPNDFREAVSAPLYAWCSKQRACSGCSRRRAYFSSIQYVLQSTEHIIKSIICMPIILACNTHEFVPILLRIRDSWWQRAPPDLRERLRGTSASASVQRMRERRFWFMTEPNDFREAVSAALYAWCSKQRACSGCSRRRAYFSSTQYGPFHKLFKPSEVTW